MVEGIFSKDPSQTLFLFFSNLRVLYGRGGSEHEDPTALALDDIGESKPMVEERRFDGVANGGVNSRKSLPKYVISGRDGSMFSLKYSIAIVERSKSSSVTLYARPRGCVEAM